MIHSERSMGRQGKPRKVELRRSARGYRVLAWGLKVTPPNFTSNIVFSQPSQASFFGYNWRNLTGKTPSFYLFKKKITLASCIACNVVKNLISKCLYLVICCLYLSMPLIYTRQIAKHDVFGIEHGRKHLLIKLKPLKLIIALRNVYRHTTIHSIYKQLIWREESERRTPHFAVQWTDSIYSGWLAN